MMYMIMLSVALCLLLFVAALFQTNGSKSPLSRRHLRLLPADNSGGPVRVRKRDRIFCIFLALRRPSFQEVVLLAQGARTCKRAA
jgi:hypothetical protein